MKTNINELEQQKSELVAIFKSTLNRLSSLIITNELVYSEASKLIDEEANKLDKKLKIKEEQNQEQNQNNNSMFNKFLGNSHKIIDVDNQTFELIANHDLRAIHVITDIAENIELFFVRAGDASIFCSRNADYTSEIEPNSSIVEFSIVSL